MARTILAMVMTLATVSGTRWNIEKVAPSIVRLSHAGGVCTAFSIHEKLGRWVTMSHCFPPEDGAPLVVNGILPVLQVLAAVPGNYGITVFTTTPVGAPALKLGAEPGRGAEVLQLGYGGGGPDLVFYPGLFVHRGLPLSTGQLLQFNSAQGMPGMSGGPILDRKYHVIGVISGGVRPTPVPTAISYGPLYAAVKAVMEKFGQ